ncbi:MAG: aldo/keto reductase, partial [Clostridiales bacterium]|nr:aldo/keto reductase [Clostridiales bacterium]
RLNRAEIRSDVHESLQALGTDYIDLLWLHRDSPDADAGEVIEILNELKQEGKIRAFAASNWTTSRMEEANQYAAAHCLTGFCAGQIRWSLAEMRPEAKDDPTLVDMDDESKLWYAKHKLAAFAFTPQAKGFFAKLLKGGADSLSPKVRTRYLSERNLAASKRVDELARQLGVSIPALSIAYLTSHMAFPAFAITGFSRVEQLKETMQAADLILTGEQLAFLEGK